MSGRHHQGLLLCATAAVLVVLGLPLPVAAQEIPPPESTEGEASADEAETQNEGLQSTARTADTGSGEVGQRQSAEDSPTMRESLGRITSRINNRIENRVRNRIDRNYDPTANATSPFEIAEDRARSAGRTGPR